MVYVRRMEEPLEVFYSTQELHPKADRAVSTQKLPPETEGAASDKELPSADDCPGYYVLTPPFGLQNDVIELQMSRSPHLSPCMSPSPCQDPLLPSLEWGLRLH